MQWQHLQGLHSGRDACRRDGVRCPHHHHRGGGGAAGRCWTWSCAFQHVLTASTVTYDESESSFLSTGLRYNILLTCMYTTADSCSLTSTIFTIVRSTMLCVYTVVDMHLEYLRLLTLYRTCSCRPGGIPQRPKSTDLPTINLKRPRPSPQRGWALGAVRSRTEGCCRGL